MKKITVLALFALVGNFAIAQKKEIKREIKTEITEGETPSKKKGVTWDAKASTIAIFDWPVTD